MSFIAFFEITATIVHAHPLSLWAPISGVYFCIVFLCVIRIMLIMRKEERLIDDFRKQTILDTTFDEPETEEFTEDDDDDFSELFNKYLREDLEVFPDGEIDQNQNISVKVEILRPIPNPREELDKLVGCADIKRRMDELVALTRYNRMMREFFPNGKRHEVSLHSVFLGRPGTGKTTVCKIFGSLLRQAGALSKGHVVVCDRSTFIGTLWGDEERSMKQVLTSQASRCYTVRYRTA